MAAPALAQQDVEKLTPIVNEGQGVAGDAPLPEEDSRENTEREETPPADPLPAPPTVNNETETEPTCDPICEAAQQREKEDLVAQQRMANSTRDIVVVTKWQLYVGGLGILLLIGTLGLTIRATNTAVEANRIARKSAERQLRAYVFMETARINNFALGEKIQIIFVVKNFGQTPADKVNYWTETCFSGGESNKPPIRQSRSGGDWGPGASVQITLTRDDIWGQDADAIDVVSGTKTMCIYGEIHYSDKFGGNQTTTYRYSYQGNGVMPPEKVLKLYYTREGNSAT